MATSSSSSIATEAFSSSSEQVRQSDSSQSTSVRDHCLFLSIATGMAAGGDSSSSGGENRTEAHKILLVSSSPVPRGSSSSGNKESNKERMLLEPPKVTLEGLQEKIRSLRKANAHQGKEIVSLKKRHSKDRLRMGKLEKEVRVLRDRLQQRRDREKRDCRESVNGSSSKKKPRVDAADNRGDAVTSTSRPKKIAYYRPRAFSEVDPLDFTGVVLKLDISKVLEDPRLCRFALKLSRMASKGPGESGDDNVKAV